MIEPAVGGRIYERTPQGEEHDWGKVTAWEPPSRITYLWHLRQDRADATEVQITFASAEPAGHGWRSSTEAGNSSAPEEPTNDTSTSAAGRACSPISKPPPG